MPTYLTVGALRSHDGKGLTTVGGPVTLARAASAAAAMAAADAADDDDDDEA